MGNVNWTIEKTRLSQFWEELPDLLLRYAEIGAQRKLIKEKEAREERLIQEKSLGQVLMEMNQVVIWPIIVLKKLN